jgi:hypothetical protein
MFLSPRRIAIRCLMPVVWRASPSRMCASLMEFSATEVDSAWQSIHAMRATRDLDIRARMFRHALDEIRHGELFAKLARKYSDAFPAAPMPERQALLSGPRKREDLITFYARELVGERSIRDDLDAYAAASPHSDIRNLFLGIKAEEAGHARFAEQSLGELSPSGWTRGALIARSRAERFYEGWVRFSGRIGNAVFSVIGSAAYFLIGLLLYSASRKRVDA